MPFSARCAYDRSVLGSVADELICLRPRSTVTDGFAFLATDVCCALAGEVGAFNLHRVRIRMVTIDRGPLGAAPTVLSSNSLIIGEFSPPMQQVNRWSCELVSGQRGPWQNSCSSSSSTLGFHG